MNNCNIRKIIITLYSPWFLLAPASVFANEFNGSISASSFLSDNAFKSATDKVDERQEEYELGLGGKYINSFLDANAAYRARQQTFSDDSQKEEGYLEGNAAVMFGKPKDPAGLQLKHSRKTLLESPDAINLVRNQEEREIYSVSPELRARIFTADNLFIRGDATRVRFLKNDLQDSKRDGATVGWIHPISKVDQVQLIAQQTDITFIHLPANDYSYSSARLVYSAALRNLSYVAQAGYNRNALEIGEDTTSPTYDLSMSYNNGLHKISVAVSRLLTDSSFGSGNSNSNSSTTSIPSTDGLSADIDLMKRMTTDISWATRAVCERCNFYISVFHTKDDYLTRDEQSITKGGSADFNYSISRAAQLVARYSHSEVEYTNRIIGAGYELENTVLEYHYRFANDVNYKIFARREDRKSAETVSGAYKENIIGLGLGYSF